MVNNELESIQKEAVMVCFFFFSFLEWGEAVYLVRRPLIGLLYQPRMIDDDRRWNKSWQGKPKYWEKTYPSATLSTTNPTRPDLGSNPGHFGGKSAINRLSYGTAMEVRI
jgi:hypothetical protein